MPLLTLDELANYLRITEKTVYRLLERKSVPALRVGRQWRFDQEAIDGWLRQNSNEAGARILVVDDDDDICSLFKYTLGKAGHHVTSAGQANQAMKCLQEAEFDLMFLDLMLPGTNGAELLKQVRVSKPDLPVTIITGFPDSDLMLKALDYGPLGAMKKPFTSSDIMAAVNNYIRFNKLSK